MFHITNLTNNQHHCPNRNVTLILAFKNPRQTGMSVANYCWILGHPKCLVNHTILTNPNLIVLIHKGVYCI